MTPQQELDIYLGKTTLKNDRVAIDLFVAPVTNPETVSTDTNTHVIFDNEQPPIEKKDIIVDDAPIKDIETNLLKDTKTTFKTDKTYKKHFYITLGIACILLLALILKK